jgi:hypothetical protein
MGSPGGETQVKIAAIPMVKRKGLAGPVAGGKHSHMTPITMARMGSSFGFSPFVCWSRRLFRGDSTHARAPGRPVN